MILLIVPLLSLRSLTSRSFLVLATSFNAFLLAFSSRMALLQATNIAFSAAARCPASSIAVNAAVCSAVGIQNSRVASKSGSILLASRILSTVGVSLTPVRS